MNRQQRRAAGGNGHRDPLCPHCNAGKVQLYFIRHGDEISSADGQPIRYEAKDSDELNLHLVIDFGILAVHGLVSRPYPASPDPYQFRVWIEALEQMVFDSDDKGIIRRPGSWQRTLAAIAVQLDEKFGPVLAPPHTVH